MNKWKEKWSVGERIIKICVRDESSLWTWEFHGIKMGSSFVRDSVFWICHGDALMNLLVKNAWLQPCAPGWQSGKMHWDLRLLMCLFSCGTLRMSNGPPLPQAYWFHLPGHTGHQLHPRRCLVHRKPLRRGTRPLEVCHWGLWMDTQSMTASQARPSKTSTVTTQPSET